MITIKGNSLTVQIKNFGAELSSITDASGREYLWQGDAKVWNRQAPILFPIVGRIVGDSYTHDGTTYYMEKHGFARRSDFEIVELTQDSASLSLRSGIDSKRSYPFDFELNISYSLGDSRLTQRNTVLNLGESDMFFSLGVHPGFVCKFGDILRFDKPESELGIYQDGNDQPLEPRETVSLENGNELVITPRLFERGSIAFSSHSSSSVSLISADGSRQTLSVNFGKAPMLWLWAKPGAEFVCIEPWYGADERIQCHELGEKKGIIRLAPGGTFSMPVVYSFS